VQRRVAQFLKRFQYFAFASLFLMSEGNSRALSQVGDSHSVPPQHSQMTPDQRSNANALVKVVRQSTQRFKDVSQAEREGYALIFGCVSGDDEGAMGLHYLNGALLNEVNNNGIFNADRL